MILPTQYLSTVLNAHPALTAPVCRLTSTFITPDSVGLLGRRDLEQTATDLKSSWDSCMDKTVCKWVAIIGIILACLVLFWLITSIIRCLCLGVQCLEALFCCCKSCCTCCNCCDRGDRRRSGNDSYVAQHQNPAPIVNNHYYDTNNRPEPEYLTIHETAPPSNAPPGYGWNAPHSGGYQKLNDKTPAVEMNTFNNGGPGNPHASSALYSDTAYRPNQTSSYDNTYNDYNNMQGVSHGSNAGYYNNRFN